MKNLTAKQIEEVKNINFRASKRQKGNALSKKQFVNIVAKKYNRHMGNLVTKSGKVIFEYTFKKPPRSDLQKLRDLLNWSIQCAGGNYFKILIEGHTGIYYAHPDYGHADYNKHRVFEKNEKTLKLMRIFNALSLKRHTSA